MGEAADAYGALDEAWRVAIDEAWRSWASGSAGVGAVVSDAEGRIVAVGRNRMLSPRDQPGVLSGTKIAHAEMNALAVCDLGVPEPLTMTTTFEPCLMCAATILQFGFAHVRYASADPFFDGIGTWFDSLAVPGKRPPDRTELGGPIGAFAHVLHASWMVFWAANADVMAAHERLRPRHLEVARSVAGDERLAGLASEGADVVDALDALWPTLLGLTPPA